MSNPWSPPRILKKRTDTFKAVVTATYNHPVDPVISYTEAARNIMHMQLYNSSIHNDELVYHFCFVMGSSVV